MRAEKEQALNIPTSAIGLHKNPCADVSETKMYMRDDPTPRSEASSTEQCPKICRPVILFTQEEKNRRSGDSEKAGRGQAPL